MNSNPRTVGFFSKKQERIEEQAKQVSSKYLIKCPICNSDGFFAIKHVGEGSTIIDISIYTGSVVGECPKCGFIGHGHIFHKGSFEQNVLFCNLSLAFLNNWDITMFDVSKRQDIDNQTKTNLINSEAAKVNNTIKVKFPDYSVLVDYQLFIKPCLEFRYKR